MRNWLYATLVNNTLSYPVLFMAMIFDYCLCTVQTCVFAVVGLFFSLCIFYVPFFLLNRISEETFTHNRNQIKSPYKKTPIENKKKTHKKELETQRRFITWIQQVKEKRTQPYMYVVYANAIGACALQFYVRLPFWTAE